MSTGVSTTGNSTWMIVTTLLFVSASTSFEGMAHTPSAVGSGGSTVNVVMYVSNGYSVSSTTTVVSPGRQFVPTSATLPLPSSSSAISSSASGPVPFVSPFDSNQCTVPSLFLQRLYSSWSLILILPSYCSLPVCSHSTSITFATLDGIPALSMPSSPVSMNEGTEMTMHPCGVVSVAGFTFVFCAD